MYSKKYSQCGFPLSGWGLNLSKGSNPYTRLPKNNIYLVSITLGETTFEVNDGFETIGELFQYMEETFVPANDLQGYFFTSQYQEFIYSNIEGFSSGSFVLSSFEDADSEYDLDEYYAGGYD
ncbi:hypothetical protein F0919_17850 [Taibaiella lutea]|uniref:Uncharacterized protein n=1 Tax=Taibaiella lutea TaxID=2608001 RepID=A0A5M6CGV2_9BACT|nr:hypothetical protein [Taibaiella lutea]KAA5532645.1 hypothetical protein F0919_17850 [Taibaiella lutea]